MDDICECKDIFVVRGDILEVSFKFTSVPKEAISRVLFRTYSGYLEVELAYSDEQDAYVLRMESDFTDNLIPAIASYDLVIELADNNLLTAVHEGLFAVLKKKNWAEECQNDGN